MESVSDDDVRKRPLENLKSVCACTSDRERSTRNPYWNKYSYWCHCSECSCSISMILSLLACGVQHREQRSCLSVCLSVWRCFKPTIQSISDASSIIIIVVIIAIKTNSLKSDLHSRLAYTRPPVEHSYWPPLNTPTIGLTKVQDVGSARPPTDRALFHFHAHTTHLASAVLLLPGHV